MKKAIPLFLAVFFLLTGCRLFPFPGLGQSPEIKAGIKTLEGMLRQGDPRDLNLFEKNISSAAKIVLDLGEAALPVLKKALYDPKEDIRNFASGALFLIGGEKARDILKKAFDKTKNEFIQMQLCLTMASTGTPEDIGYLMKFLESGQDQNERAASAAFLSLVVLKPERMIRESSSGAGAGMDSEWKELFLLSLNTVTEASAQMKTAGREDKIILTLFQSGIPGTDQSPVLLETERERTWKLENKAWSFFQDDNREIYQFKGLSDVYKPPYIDFAIHINQAGTRALANVGVTFGSKAGHRYAFVLKHIKGQWKVVGMVLTGIS